MKIINFGSVKKQLPKISSRSETDLEKVNKEDITCKPPILSKKQQRKIEEARSLEPFRYKENPDQVLPDLVVASQGNSKAPTINLSGFFGGAAPKPAEEMTPE